ncbi:MAG: glutaredoxin 2 [Bacteriovoracaceae bacterium]
MTTLYHYSHCPFCVRVRLAFGLLNINYNTRLVAYNDEETPTKLIGKKMLPVVTDDNGKAMPESLDIINHYDISNVLNTNAIKSSKEFAEFEEFLGKVNNLVHSLCMPHWAYTKEFDAESRAYFQEKKEAKRGPFKNLVLNREKFENDLKPLLTELEYKLTPYFKNSEISIYDVMISASLWGLYVLPEFRFSPNIHAYLQNIKKRSHFDYQKDLWK